MNETKKSLIAQKSNKLTAMEKELIELREKLARCHRRMATVVNEFNSYSQTTDLIPPESALDAIGEMEITLNQQSAAGV